MHFCTENSGTVCEQPSDLNSGGGLPSGFITFGQGPFPMGSIQESCDLKIVALRERMVKFVALCTTQ